MNTITVDVNTSEIKKLKKNQRETFRLLMEIIRTTVPIAILTIQILIYFQ
jgi:hypothetical protein